MLYAETTVWQGLLAARSAQEELGWNLPHPGAADYAALLE